MAALATHDFAVLKQALQSISSAEELHEAIVNLPFTYEVETASLFLGIIVLLIVNKDNQTIDRIALTNNVHAERAKRRSAKKFEAIKIPVDYPENIIAQAIATGLPTSTGDWRFLFMPELTPEQAAFNQADAGIGYSAVYPICEQKGALIFSYYQTPDMIGAHQQQFMQKYAALVSEVLSP